LLPENLILAIEMRIDVVKLTLPLLFLALGIYFSMREAFDVLAEGHPSDHYALTLWAAVLVVRSLAEVLHSSEEMMKKGVAIWGTGHSDTLPAVRDRITAIANSRVLDVGVALSLLFAGVLELVSGSESFWHAGIAFQGLMMLLLGFQSVLIGASSFEIGPIRWLSKYGTIISAIALIFFGFLGSAMHLVTTWKAGHVSFEVAEGLGPHHGMLAIGWAALKGQVVPLVRQISHISHRMTE
jgi:hypothetical protein